MLPYTKSHLDIDRCRQIADELRKTGKYRAVRVRKTVGEFSHTQGRFVQYGKVYVESK